MSAAHINIAPVQSAPSVAANIAAAQPVDAAAGVSAAKTFASVLQAAQQASGPASLQFSSLPVAIAGLQPLPAALPAVAPPSASPSSTPSAKNVSATSPPKQDVSAAESPAPIIHASVARGLQLVPQEKSVPPFVASPASGKTGQLTADKLAPEQLPANNAIQAEAQPAKSDVRKVVPSAHPAAEGSRLPAADTHVTNDHDTARTEVPVETAPDNSEISSVKPLHATPVLGDSAPSRAKTRITENEMLFSANAVVAAPLGAPPAAPDVVVQAAAIPPIVSAAAGAVSQSLPSGKQAVPVVKAAFIQASTAPALSAVLPATKQNETAPNKQGVPALSGPLEPPAGQPAHSSSQEDTTPTLVKSDGHAGKFAEALAEVQAQPATALHGEGASFSLSLTRPAAHDPGAATIAANTPYVARAMDSADAFGQATPTSSPVKRLEVTVQDPVLGSLGVQAEMRSGVLHASLSGTQEAMGASLSSLRHYLTDQQIAVSSLTFSSPGERVNGSAHASGASDSMRQSGQGAANDSSFSPDRHGRGEPQQQRQAPPSATDHGITQTIPVSVTNVLPQRQAGSMPAGSTVSIHI